MTLNPSQQQTLKADITAKAAPGQPLELLVAAQNWDGVADFYNTTASPAFYVWRTSVSRVEIYGGNPQPENTFFDWTVYKNQSVTEQNAWGQMFMGDQANFALDNIRAGVTAIFSGAGAATQRTHILAVARRQANTVERLFATGTGSTSVPGKLVVEGALSGRDVLDVRNA